MLFAKSNLLAPIKRLAPTQLQLFMSHPNGNHKWNTQFPSDSKLLWRIKLVRPLSMYLDGTALPQALEIVGI